MAGRLARLSRTADAGRRMTPYALKVLTADLLMALTDEEVDEVIREADFDGDPQINHEEFSKYMAQADGVMGIGVEDSTDTENELTEDFKVEDRDSSGFSTAAELRHYITNSGKKNY